jgi:hypothetical protein
MLQPLYTIDMRIPIKERGPAYVPLKQRNIKLGANGYVDLHAPDVTIILDPIAMLEERVEALKEGLFPKKNNNIVLSTMKKYEQVIYDYEIDRLDSNMLLQIANKLEEPGTHNKMIETSLIAAHLLYKSKKSTWFMNPETLIWTDLTGQEVSKRELDIEAMPEIKVPPLKKLKGYLLLKMSKLGEKTIQFMIIDDTKALSHGFVCEKTSTLKTDDVKAAILELNKTCFAEGSKTNRCSLYELTLRHYSRPNNMLFARPVEATIALAEIEANMKKNKNKK